mmetsp:Transcript_41784/g.105359  ORF Transcript_41784/g.105359 Transcript_41784/m.105359 type:complete len:368 (-) Transcript_41784:758-1861(-)
MEDSFSDVALALLTQFVPHRVVRCQRRAMFTHMRKVADGAYTWECHTILAHDLAMGHARIGILASLRNAGGRVVKVQRIHVPVGKLGALNLILEVTKHAAFLQHHADKDVAHHVEAIRVSPRILFRDGDQASEVDSAAFCLRIALNRVEVGGVQSHVHARKPDFICWGNDRIENAEQHHAHLGGERTRKVILGCIDPTVEHVVESIVETFSVVVEEGERCVYVELLTSLACQRDVDHVKVSLLSLSDPGFPWCFLNTGGWPIVGSVGRLHNIELALLPDGHGSMSSVCTHGPGQHRVDAIQTDNGQKVPRLESALRKLFGELETTGPLDHIIVGVISQKVTIGIGHCLWDRCVAGICSDEQKQGFVD